MMLGAYAQLNACFAESMSLNGGPSEKNDRSDDAADASPVNTRITTLAETIYPGKSRRENNWGMDYRFNPLRQPAGARGIRIPPQLPPAHPAGAPPDHPTPGCHSASRECATASLSARRVLLERYRRRRRSAFAEAQLRIRRRATTGTTQHGKFRR